MNEKATNERLCAEDWLDSLETQTLTDELKDDIKNEFEIDKIEFAKNEVRKIQVLQKLKYTAGESGYIVNEEWETIINNIK